MSGPAFQDGLQFRSAHFENAVFAPEPKATLLIIHDLRNVIVIQPMLGPDAGIMPVFETAQTPAFKTNPQRAVRSRVKTENRTARRGDERTFVDKVISFGPQQCSRDGANPEVSRRVL